MNPATLLKVKLLHGFYHVFKTVQMVPNRSKRIIWNMFSEGLFLVCCFIVEHEAEIFTCQSGT